VTQDHPFLPKHWSKDRGISEVEEDEEDEGGKEVEDAEKEEE
jgi:hypothetical protein